MKRLHFPRKCSIKWQMTPFTFSGGSQTNEGKGELRASMFRPKSRILYWRCKFGNIYSCFLSIKLEEIESWGFFSGKSHSCMFIYTIDVYCRRHVANLHKAKWFIFKNAFCKRLQYSFPRNQRHVTFSMLVTIEFHTSWDTLETT